MAKTSGIARGTNPAGVGAGIAGERLKNSIAIPNQHDNNAKLFKELSGSFQAKGDRPRGIFANAASGFFSGMEHAENSKSIAKKTEKAEQYDKVMQYFQEVNNSAIERNEWFEKRESARKQALPAVLAYMNNIDKLDPQSQFLMAQNILNQYSSATGDSLKLVSIGGSNPNMVTVEGEKGVSVLDLSTLFAGNDALEEQIAHKSVDYQLAVQEKRDIKAKELDMKEKEFQAKYPNYGKEDEEGGGQEKTLDIGSHSYKVGDLARSEKTARSEYQKKVYKDIDAIPKNNQALEAIETMREVFDRNPNIGSSLINMLDNPDGNDSWWNLLGKKLSGEDLADMEILKKATNDLNLDTILGVTGKAATDLLKKAIQAASPSGKLTKKGFDVNASKWEKKAREANELAMAKYDAMQKGMSLVPSPRGTSNVMKGPTDQSNEVAMNEDEGNPFGSRWKKVQ